MELGEKRRVRVRDDLDTTTDCSMRPGEALRWRDAVRECDGAAERADGFGGGVEIHGRGFVVGQMVVLDRPQDGNSREWNCGRLGRGFVYGKHFHVVVRGLRLGVFGVEARRVAEDQIERWRGRHPSSLLDEPKRVLGAEHARHRIGRGARCASAIRIGSVVTGISKSCSDPSSSLRPAQGSEQIPTYRCGKACWPSRRGAGSRTPA